MRYHWRMDPTYLLPWLSVPVLISAVTWLAQELISKRLAKSIEYEFTVKLDALRQETRKQEKDAENAFSLKIEAVRAEMKASEARLNAELRLKEAEITALRSGALTALASRHVAFDKRQLEAADQLWAANVALSPARTYGIILSNYSFERLSSAAAADKKLREVFGSSGLNFDPGKVDFSGAAKARPFVTPMVWAAYSAIQAAVMHGVARWTLIKSGIENTKLVNDLRVKELIIAALPHWSEHLEQHGPDMYHKALDQLDALLLKELQKMLSGAEVDQASIDQAGEILRRAEQVQQQNSEQTKQSTV